MRAIISAVLAGVLGTGVIAVSDAHAATCSDKGAVTAEDSGGISVDASYCTGVQSGNDTDLIALLNAGSLFTPDYDTSGLVWTQTGKSDEPGPVSTSSSDGLSGTWSVDPELSNQPFVISLKGGKFYQAFLFDGVSLLVGGGTFDMTKSDIEVGNGNTPQISHLTLAAPVPLPASLPMLLAALAGVGWLARRGRPA